MVKTKLNKLVQVHFVQVQTYVKILFINYCIILLKRHLRSPFLIHLNINQIKYLFIAMYTCEHRDVNNL